MICIQNSPIRNPIFEEDRTQRDLVINKIAWEVFFECLATFAVAAIACAFAATPAALGFILGAAVIQVILNIALRTLGTSIENREDGISNMLSWGTAFNFSWGTGIYKQTIIHELGHALGALAMYRNARPKITLLPFFGGNTHFFPQHLSTWGRKLGAERALAVVTAAGPGLTLLASSLELSAGILNFDKHPKLSRYLIVMAAFDFFWHANYAISALTAPPHILSHDFVRLRLYGFNPVAAAIGIIAIPLLIAGGLYCFKKCRTPN